ncbi:DDHD domain-containing protein [Coccidioides immitis RS]|uniref:DDHD domain-containing protein n=3 Tax=Coccidioides immitis TaxID=5501 RepID=J3KGM6_COCIM|nr:DDHD domain-containing protein [Coccidioides immitis RS]EAS34909.3 DDHD domain-containing protein [Coccidioides immitis RS]KMP00102.1 phospholipase [Coccidioides immitis RMSCC 2394]KMU84281.1 phospholipase [Coccidioides immitis H538.4]
MATPAHTYGPACLLYEPPEQRRPILDPTLGIPEPPKIQSQYFYLSSLPIDDPLTAIPAPSSNPDVTKLPPRPFSVHDNIALEEAWQRLKSAVEEQPDKNPDETEGQVRLRRGVTAQGKKRGEAASQDVDVRRTTVTLSELSSRTPLHHSNDGIVDIHETRDSTSPSHIFRGSSVESHAQRRVTRDRGSSGASEIGNIRKRHSIPIERRSKAARRNRDSSPGLEEDVSEEASGHSTPHIIRPSDDTNISGSPFIRAPIRDREIRRSTPTLRLSKDSVDTSPSTAQVTASPSADVDKLQGDTQSERLENDEPEATVTVGASRLHLVEFPRLQMKPIYWSPVHDISPVIRATWFYKNSMLPVEPEVANRLEAGYMYLKPWTETWQDELNSCVENGAEAEMKVVYKLWPPEDTKLPIRPGSRPGSEASASVSSSREVGDHAFQGNYAAGATATSAASAKLFKNSSVMYVDSKDAQILRPSLLPSVAGGRRPLSAIRKGRQIGIAVVRGFNRREWEKVHPPKLVSPNVRNFMKMQEAATREAASRRQICYACQMEEKKPEVSDLVFVIHGIGQKLSERVESFHFTHAMNSFRRQVNIELSSNSVWPNMRPDLENIMVLPVNWRSTLSLEDTDVEEAIEDQHNANRFVLKDITPETIPAVRNLISDVMLDIPYYLSHHKQKMVRAVIKEANRIYRLWCQNNPGFQQSGKVHIIAHSLGSIMAMDILSQQPTILPHIDFSKTDISESIFEFDTRNVFFCGSPAGFFLLLHKSSLLPRRYRNKPGCDEYDVSDPGLTGEAGTYGCFAIDNLYNVMHETDPIAYRLNAAVDSDLANSLKPASVPTSSTSFFQTISSVFRWNSKPQSSRLEIPAHSVAGSSTAAQQRPGIFTKLPSTIEMETHDFTREEIAEKRMLLLNDNGQIDYYISGGGGPLNIQYLNMLSAHSSYWILPDFVRFIVVEIGRRVGRSGTLLALRAEKKKGWKRK